MMLSFRASRVNAFQNLLILFGMLLMLLNLSGCADAGRDQSVTAGERVVLDGSASTPREGWKIIKYRWKQLKGKHVKLQNKESVKATFIAPDVKKRRRLVFRLITTEVSPSGYKLKFRDIVKVYILPKEDKDKTPPVITLNGKNPYILEAGEDFIDPGAKAVDDHDGELAVTISGEVDNRSVGEYKLVYIAKDKSGNEANATRVVKVVDTTPPTIKLKGKKLLVIERDSNFSDPGVALSDNAKGEIRLEREGEVDTQYLGERLIFYKAIDANGNEARNYRVVRVIDSSEKMKERVEWFLNQHEDMKKGYFIGKFGVRNNPTGWDHGRYLRAYIDMYEASGDVRILRKLNELLKIVADGNDKITGLKDDRTNSVLPGWGHGWEYDKFGPDENARYSEMLTNALYAYSFAAFARIVKEDPSLQKEFGDDANRYFQVVQEIYEAHKPFVTDNDSPYEDGSKGVYFEYPQNYYEDGEDYSHVEAPINLTTIIAEPLIEMYIASFADGKPNNKYKEIVTKVGNYIWDNMTLHEDERGNYVVWLYWPADIDGKPHMEDVTHGIKIAQFAASLYNANIQKKWDKTKLHYIANSFLLKANLGDGKFANYIDGTGGIFNSDDDHHAADLYGWLVLEAYSYNDSLQTTIADVLKEAMEKEGDDLYYNFALFTTFTRFATDQF